MTPWIFAAAAVLCLAARTLLARRTFDATPLLRGLAPLNAATFWIRKGLGRSRGPIVIENEDKSRLFAYAGDAAPALEARERKLRTGYDLRPLFENSSAYVYRENLYILDLLDRHATVGLPIPLRSVVRALDVGSSDFRYAFALERWLRLHARGAAVSLAGIELDADRVGRDFRSRRDHAEAFAAQIEGSEVNYEAGDFLEHDETGVDVVFLFLPFVLEYTLLRWGLPRRYFDPESVFAHVKRTLRPGGLAIVMNHTEEERQRQIELFTAYGFEVRRSTGASSQLVDYGSKLPERSISVARRPD